MSTFGWCTTGHHKDCRREVENFWIDTKRGKSVIVYTGETSYCECPKRGCPCYVKVADRKKTKTRRRKT